MNSQQIYAYQQALLNQALTEGIKRNEEQSKTWMEYKKKHKDVIQALQVLPLEVSVNCMVPVGKKALMRGSLTHTNEILACLGEGYFVKYSAAQAIALCNRRIQCADEMLKNLEKERNLYEMRQVIPSDFDVFGEDGRKDLVEHWDEQKLEDWRVQHRQKEKEYHTKLSELRKKQKTEIETEEDLFKRLDELELEEELEDELNRLEDEYNSDDKENEEEDYYESEEDSSEEKVDEMLERELEKLKDIRKCRSAEHSTEVATGNDSSQHTNISKDENFRETPLSTENKRDNEPQRPNIEVPSETTNDSSQISNNDELLMNETEKSNSNNRIHDITENTENKHEKSSKNSKTERRVSFADVCILENNNTESTDARTLGQKATSTNEKNHNYEESSDEDEIIRIDFKHSNNELNVPINYTDSIETPRDIYRIFGKPKSILKRTHNEANSVQNILSTTDYSSDEEDEIETARSSAYKFVVKDVQERSTPMPAKVSATQPKCSIEKPVSKFKRERAKMMP